MYVCMFNPILTSSTNKRVSAHIYTCNNDILESMRIIIVYEKVHGALALALSCLHDTSGTAVTVRLDQREVNRELESGFVMI